MSCNSPLPYSDDNKRYHTWNYYLKHRFHNRVFKAPLNANFSCLNRDGTCGAGGCTLCSTLGSGGYTRDIHDGLLQQLDQGMQIMQRKWPAGIPMVYFQVYINTYVPPPVLKTIFGPFVQCDGIVAISIATHVDYLESDKIAYL